MTDTYDVIIVGGGIVGTCCAEYCARAGLSVLLVEKDIIGSGTTAAGMGHIVVLDDSDIQFQFCLYSRSLWTELARQYGEKFEWEKRGTIWIAADDEEMDIVRAKHKYYSDHGVNSKVLDTRSLYQLEPSLKEGLVGGLLVPDDAMVYSPSAARFFADQAAIAGAEISLHTPVTKINSNGSISLANGDHIFGGIVINAAGCWSPELTCDVPVFKRKGHLVVTNRYPDMIRHQLIELGYLKSAHNVSSDSVAFNLHPRSDGKILIGSSRQSDDQSSEIDYDILGRMLKRSFEYMPNLKDANAMRCWTGFRPATPDKLPLIGPCPDNSRVWLATGHEGLGITTSMATGAIIMDMIEGRDSAIPTDPFLPSRIMAGEGVSG